MFSLRRVTRKDGQLRNLGMGRVKVASAAAKRLRRWSIELTVWSALFGVLNGAMSCTGAYGAVDCGKVIYGCYFIYTWSLVFGWYLTLQEAAILISEAVIVVRKRMVKTACSSADWDGLVVPEVLKLVNETLPALSNGWVIPSLTSFLKTLIAGTADVTGLISVSCVPLVMPL